jgi:hypothetical protein
VQTSRLHRVPFVLCACAANQALFSWGRGDFGQLGTGQRRKSTHLPERVPLLPRDAVAEKVEHKQRAAAAAAAAPVMIARISCGSHSSIVATVGASWLPTSLGSSWCRVLCTQARACLFGDGTSTEILVRLGSRFVELIDLRPSSGLGHKKDVLLPTAVPDFSDVKVRDLSSGGAVVLVLGSLKS